jgi:hypothetical protein
MFWLPLPMRLTGPDSMVGGVTAGPFCAGPLGRGPLYVGPLRVLEHPIHYFLLQLGDQTDKVSTLHLKPAQLTQSHQSHRILLR